MSHASNPKVRHCIRHHRHRRSSTRRRNSLRNLAPPSPLPLASTPERRHCHVNMRRMHLTRLGADTDASNASLSRGSVVDVDEIMVPRGGGWDANQLAGRFGDAARTGDGWTASPTRSLIRAQNSDWGWCGDATAMPENLPGATT